MDRRAPPRYRWAVLGGTFDRFHAGHRALLAAAFRSADRIGIGVTTPRYLARHPKAGAAQIQSFRTRSAAVRRWARKEFPSRTFELVPLDSAVGGALRPEADLLVASAGTIAGAQRILRERARRGLPHMSVRLVPLVLGSDRLPIASSRIRKGRIDREGRRRSPLRIELVTDGKPEIVRRASAAIRGLYRGLPARSIEIRLRVVPGSLPRAARPPWRTRARALAKGRIGRTEIRVGFYEGARGRRGWAAATAAEYAQGTSGARSLEPELAIRAAFRALERSARQGGSAEGG